MGSGFRGRSRTYLQVDQEGDRGFGDFGGLNGKALRSACDTIGLSVLIIRVDHHFHRLYQ
jgi:hypothetical protein